MSDLSPTPDAIYQVPVPAQDLEAVYEFLANRSRERQFGKEPGVTVIPSADLIGRETNKSITWDDSLLERLIRSNAKSVKILVEIMDVIASDPDHTGGMYGRKQLMKHVSATEGSFTVAFTKWSAHFKSQYDGITSWPIVGQNTEEGHTVYWMTDEVKDRWKQLRSL